MMPELMLDTRKYAQRTCWLFADDVIRYFVTPMLPFGETQKREIALQNRSVGRSQPQFKYMLRGKIAHVAATFPHIKA